MKEIEQARTGTSENGNKLCVVKSHQSDLHVLLNIQFVVTGPSRRYKFIHRCTITYYMCTPKTYVCIYLRVVVSGSLIRSMD